MIALAKRAAVQDDVALLPIEVGADVQTRIGRTALRVVAEQNALAHADQVKGMVRVVQAAAAIRVAKEGQLSLAEMQEAVTTMDQAAIAVSAGAEVEKKNRRPNSRRNCPSKRQRSC